MQYVDYQNAISDFSYLIFGQNPFWGSIIWRIIAFFSLFYFMHIAYKIIYKHEKTKLIWYFLITFIFTLILRIPLLGTGETCIDEGQAISSAARLAFDGKLYVDVDGTTQGPFMLYLLSILPKIGIPLSYTSIRLFDVVCIWFPSLLLIYATIRNYTNKETAILATMPFFVFASTLNMLHLTNFNTERIPFVFIFASLYFLSNLHTNSKNLYLNLFGLGISCTLMSLAKLQSGPFSLLFFIYGMILTFNSKHKIKSNLVLIFAVLAPIAMFLLSIMQNNSFEAMKIRYIETTLYYTKYGLHLYPVEITLKDQILAGLFVFFRNANFVILLFGFSIVVLYYAKLSNKSKEILVKNKNVLYFFLMFILSSVYLVSKPGNNFGHYGNYYIAPFYLLLAFLFTLFSEKINTSKHIYFIAFIPFFFIIALGATSYKSTFKFTAALHSNSEKYFQDNIPVNSQIALWGWDNNLYLEANSMQATSISHTYYQIIPFKYQQYYIDQYIQELKKSKAKYFIDVTTNSSFFFYYKDHRYELTPKVKEFVDAHYKYDTTIDGKRFFKLKNHN